MTTFAIAFVVGTVFGICLTCLLFIVGDRLRHYPYNDAQVSYEERQKP